MKFIRENMVPLLLLAIIVVQLMTWYGRKDKPNNIKDIIAAKDETIRAVQRERDTYREWKDSTVSSLNQKNEALIKEYKTTVIKYEKIPVYINSLSNDSLRAAAERWGR